MRPRIITRVQLEDLKENRIFYGAPRATQADIFGHSTSGITGVLDQSIAGSCSSRLAGYGLHIPQSGNDQ